MEHKLDPDALAEAWSRYKLEDDPEARNLLAMHYVPLVRAISRKFAAQLPRNVDKEDLMSYGLFGLLKALTAFELDRQVKFETYAATRIKGAIIDELRSLDWVPRTVRAKARDVQAAETELQLQHNRPPTDAELAEHMGIPLLDLWQIQADTDSGVVGTFWDAGDVNGSDTAERHAVMKVFDHGGNPEDLYGTVEVGEMLAGAIDSLPQRFKNILTLYYLHDMTLAEIGVILGVTESRVCQLQSKLLSTLHESLAQGLAAAA